MDSQELLKSFSSNLEYGMRKLYLLGTLLQEREDVLVLSTENITEIGGILLSVCEFKKVLDSKYLGVESESESPEAFAYKAFIDASISLNT